MSRLYEMHVIINHVSSDIEDAIIEACNDNWCFDDWSSERDFVKTHKRSKKLPDRYQIEGRGQSSLCGGESEEQFGERLVCDIWKAAGRFVEVIIDATYLENLPCNSYSYGEIAHKRWKSLNEKSLGE